MQIGFNVQHSDPTGVTGPASDPFEELGLTLDVREEAGSVRVR